MSESSRRARVGARVELLLLRLHRLVQRRLVLVRRRLGARLRAIGAGFRLSPLRALSLGRLRVRLVGILGVLGLGVRVDVHDRLLVVEVVVVRGGGVRIERDFVAPAVVLVHLVVHPRLVPARARRALRGASMTISTECDASASASSRRVARCGDGDGDGLGRVDGGKRRRRCAAFSRRPRGAPEPRIDGLFRSTPSGPRGPASGSSSRRRPGIAPPRRRQTVDDDVPVAHRTARAVVRISRRARSASVGARGPRARAMAPRPAGSRRAARPPRPRTRSSFARLVLAVLVALPLASVVSAQDPPTPLLSSPALPPSPPPSLPQPRPPSRGARRLERVLDRVRRRASVANGSVRGRGRRRRGRASARPARAPRRRRARRRPARATSGCRRVGRATTCGGFGVQPRRPRRAMIPRRRFPLAPAPGPPAPSSRTPPASRTTPPPRSPTGSARAAWSGARTTTGPRSRGADAINPAADGASVRRRGDLWDEMTAHTRPVDENGTAVAAEDGAEAAERAPATTRSTVRGIANHSQCGVRRLHRRRAGVGACHTPPCPPRRGGSSGNGATRRRATQPAAAAPSRARCGASAAGSGARRRRARTSPSARARRRRFGAVRNKKCDFCAPDPDGSPETCSYRGSCDAEAQACDCEPTMVGEYCDVARTCGFDRLMATDGTCSRPWAVGLCCPAEAGGGWTATGVASRRRRRVRDVRRARDRGGREGCVLRGVPGRGGVLLRVGRLRPVRRVRRGRDELSRVARAPRGDAAERRGRGRRRDGRAPRDLGGVRAESEQRRESGRRGERGGFAGDRGRRRTPTRASRRRSSRRRRRGRGRRLRPRRPRRGARRRPRRPRRRGPPPPAAAGRRARRGG